MSIQSLRDDPEFQALPPERQDTVLREYVRKEQERNRAERPPPQDATRGPLGTVPNLVRPPERTGSTAEELVRPMKEGMEDPTFTERYLPKNFVTTALSGVERGARLGLGALGTVTRGVGNVIEQGLEQAPRLVGQPAASTPVSRVAGEVPGLIAQAKVPSGKPSPRVARARDAEALRADAAVAEVPLTGAEATGSPLLRRVEGIVESLPFGSGRIGRYKEGQRAATEAATERAGTAIHPEVVSKTAGGEAPQRVSLAKVRTAQEAEATRQASRAAQAGSIAEAPVRDFVTTLGPGEESAAFLSGTQRKLRDAERVARSKAESLYKEAEDLAGDAPIIRLQNTAQQAGELAAQEARLGALRQQPTAGVSQSLRNMAVEFSEQYGLHELRTIDYKTARVLDARVGAKIRVAQRAGDDDAARQLRLLQKALRHDIDDFAAGEPGDLGQKLREANEFYRTRVAEPFGGKSTIRGLQDTKEARKLDKILFDPKGAERTTAIRAELERTDPAAWRAVERRFGDRLLRDAFDPTTGRFDTSRFTRALDQYTPESLNAILGDKVQAVNAIRARFQRAAGGAQPVDNPVQAARIFREFAKAAPEVIVENLAKRPTSQLVELKASLQPADWSRLARSWWDEVVLPRSHSPDTQMFSRKRFLTELGRHDDEKLALLLGDDAGEQVATLRRVLQAQEKLHPLGDNPSGSAKMALATGQLIEVGALAGALYSGNTTGIASGGAIILAPMALAQLLTSPTGSRLLVEGARAVPGTAAARQIAQRLAIYLANQEGRSAPERTAP